MNERDTLGDMLIAMHEAAVTTQRALEVRRVLERAHRRGRDCRRTVPL
jgi:hypothetical protein